MTLRKRRIILIIAVLVFLAAVPVLFLYSTGYRIDSGLKLYKTGGLYISSPLANSKIFINNQEKGETNILQSGLFFQNLKPGEYSILIAKDGFWPWAKKLRVKEQFVTEARAMLIPKEPEGKILLREDYSPLKTSEYEEILTFLKNLQKPITAKTTPEQMETRYSRFTSDKKERLWLNPETNQVWVEWLGDENSIPYYFCNDDSCEGKIMILNSKFPVRSVDFYPKRKDIIIISVQNAVYAIEIDARGGRLLQPIYKGKEPVSMIYKNDASAYILEENNLIKIKLE